MGAGLQWRAGERQPIVIAVDPSMEGRAIARPNPVLTKGVALGATIPSMEGRAIARPNEAGRETRRDVQPPSMEGRAIARPNDVRVWATGRTARLLQWRAGQLPGQTRRRQSHPLAAVRPSMEGRAIARPNSSHLRALAHCGASSFNGGPGNCPAKPTTTGSGSGLLRILQWRAGQLPGQTRRERHVNGSRAARLQWRAGQLPGQTQPVCLRPGDGFGPSMEGRAIARPNLTGRAVTVTVTVPSMEGRAIARPNPSGRCSAKWSATNLQWRAGQLPGQTTPTAWPSGRRSPLQWRAGQLPGQTANAQYRVLAINPLQWRAGQLPGQTPSASRSFASISSLQWRAGQLPGQTSSGSSGPTRHRTTFNGGPGNCPAKPQLRRRTRVGALGPSMEGRAIARPNLPTAHS